MTAMTTLAQMLPWLHQAQLHGAPDTAVLRVHTDTRTLAAGDLFVALRGEHFDGNTLLAQARAAGAVAALCHPDADRSGLADWPCLVVPDTRRALGELARGWRRQFALELIAVTGSNGKTTVTQMLASVLAHAHPDGTSLATRGNLNNEIGVPMTLLRLRAQHHCAAVELGMNHVGEIAVLAAMVQPTVAIVNNAQREHQEFLHSVRAVALENGSVINALTASGTVVVPADDAFTPLWRTLAGKRRVCTFGLLPPQHGEDGLGAVHAQWDNGAWQVRACGLGVQLCYSLRVAGRHNVKNSLAAATAALAARVSAQAVEHGLSAFEAVQGRSRTLTLALQGRSIHLVDDTYNANPDSVRAAIDVLTELPGARVLVLGDMGEVGHQGPRFHAEAGAYAQARGVEHLLAVGTAAQTSAQAFQGAEHFESVEALVVALKALLPQVRSVLVKGSRFMRMERVVEALAPLQVDAGANWERRHDH